MLFPLKTEESTSQSKGCDAKLQGPVIWQPAARYSLRVRESETLHLLVKMRRLPLQESERAAGLQGFRALYQPFGRCGALLFWLK